MSEEAEAESEPKGGDRAATGFADPLADAERWRAEREERDERGERRSGRVCPVEADGGLRVGSKREGWDVFWIQLHPKTCRISSRDIKTNFLLYRSV